MYKNSYNKSTLTLILTANGFSDLLSKLEATQKLAELDKELLADLQKSKDVVSKSMNELTNKKQELENLKSKNQASLTEINTKKASLESLMVQFNQERKRQQL